MGAESGLPSGAGVGRRIVANLAVLSAALLLLLPIASTRASTAPPALPVVSVTSLTQTVTEKAGFATISVTADPGPRQDVTVDYTTAGGTATPGADFSATAGTLTIPKVPPDPTGAPGPASTATIAVPIIDDTTHEDDEDFTLTLSNPVGATLGAATTDVKITDDDPVPPRIIDPMIGITAATLQPGVVGVIGHNAPGVPGSVTIAFDGKQGLKPVRMVQAVALKGNTFTARMVLPVAIRDARSGVVTVTYPGSTGSIIYKPAKATANVAALGRDPFNPLGLLNPPLGSNPIFGARFFVDEQYGLANRAAAEYARSGKSAKAKLMRVIADQPETHRFGTFDGQDIGPKVRAYLDRVAMQGPGRVPLIATYRLLHPRCGNYDGGGTAEAAKYKDWYRRFAQGIGNSPAVIFLEIDATITAHCLSNNGRALRYGMLKYAAATLGALPHTIVYIDGGASDGPYREPAVADFLKRYGVQYVQGFFLNATHYVVTKKEVAFGTKISKLLGGKHFVVNTAVNGRGPLIPKSRVKNGNSVRCNPSGRGLGPKPTYDTRRPLVDGYFWIGNPGRSTGDCGRKDPPTGEFFPDYALMLAKNARFALP